MGNPRQPAKLRPKVEAEPAALEAAHDAAQTPESDAARAALRMQLKKLLREDEALAGEIAQLWGTIATAAGDGSVALGRDVTGSRIIPGDKNAVLEGSTVGGDVVSGENLTINKPRIIQQTAASAATSRHQLPSPPRDFTGRADELDELLTQLEKGGVTISGLQGQVGVGKTTLALKLAQRISARSPNAQIYLDLKGVSPQPLTAADAMKRVIWSYRPEARLSDNEAAWRAIDHSVLHDQRALLLMDNAASRAQASRCCWRTRNSERQQARPVYRTGSSLLSSAPEERPVA